MENYTYKGLGEVDIIIDGHNLMYRYFDYTGMDLKFTKDGKPTISVLRLLMQIKKLYSKFRVRSLQVAFDDIRVNKTTIRHILYSEYKANRPKTDPQLLIQFDYIKECLEAAEINYIVAPELFEGDDVIGTVAHYFNSNKQRTIIVSSDKDMMQLVDDYTAFYCLTKAGTPNILYSLNTSNPEINMKSIRNELGVSPTQLVELKGLTGEITDNIPGVKGIGEKTALPLVQKYLNLDSIYDEVDLIVKEDRDLTNTLFTKGMIEKLKANEQMAYLSRELAIIHRNIKINIQKTRGNMRSEKAMKVFAKYELDDLIKTLSFQPQ